MNVPRRWFQAMRPRRALVFLAGDVLLIALSMGLAFLLRFEWSIPPRYREDLGILIALAEELIRLHGLEPDEDVPIVFIGVRPGEKLQEEILTAEEGTEATKHIFELWLHGGVNPSLGCCHPQ